MKYLQKFESLSSQPRYLKNKFILFCKEDLDLNFVKKILSKYEINNVDFYETPNSYIIECNGIDILKSIVEDYPEFFTSFSKIDINFEEAYRNCDLISQEIIFLQDELGTLDSFGNMKFPKNWNQDIDSIIKKLKYLKI